MRLAAACLLLLSAAPAFAQSYMVGTWFGSGQPGDRAAMYIDRMKPDGAWRGEYRTCRKGKPDDLVQTGRWSLNGDTLVLKVETVGGMPAPRTDIYRMVAHDAKSQKYLSLPWNFTYAPRKVEDSFQMPPCDLVS